MIKRNIKNRLKHLLWSSDMEATRFTLSIAAMMWALFLGWPGELFPTPDEIDVGRGRMTYAIMAQIMSENSWAFLWLVQGVAMMYSLLTGHRNCLMMAIDAILGVILWTICVGSSFLVYWPHADFWTAVITYKPPAAMAGEVGMIAASWWVLVRYSCQRKCHD